MKCSVTSHKQPGVLETFASSNEIHRNVSWRRMIFFRDESYSTVLRDLSYCDFSARALIVQPIAEGSPQAGRLQGIVAANHNDDVPLAHASQLRGNKDIPSQREKASGDVRILLGVWTTRMSSAILGAHACSWRSSPSHWLT